MGFSGALTAVFIETNLGTRFAVPASPDITAEDFKREVERMHLNFFPEFGDISVKAVMVKRKSRCYHLSESLPLKYAFLGSNITWFLQARVNQLDAPVHVGSLKHNDTKVHNLNSTANVITGSVELGGCMMPSSDKRMECKRKKVKVQRSPYLKASTLKISALSCFLRKRKRKIVKRNHPIQGLTQHSLIEKEMLCRFATGAEVNWSKKSDTNVSVEAISETISEPASVSGIIKKYFADYDEVTSSPKFPFTTVRHINNKLHRSSAECRYSSMQSGIMSPVVSHNPKASQDVWLEKPCSDVLIEKHNTPDVGKRLLLASNDLGLTPSNRKSILSLCHYNDGESPFHKMTAPLVFERADEGD